MGDRRLLCLGFGYVAAELARQLDDSWQITGTTRSREGFADMEALGVTPVEWPGDDLAAHLAVATHVVSSVPPRDAGDPVADLIEVHKAGLNPGLEWLSLLSTTGVYGNQGGDWVDEDAPVVPATHRGGLRAEQEKRWLGLHRADELPVHIFRLSGIYGPGRSAFDKLRAGTARRIVRPGQVFSRCHVTDIAAILRASIDQPRAGGVYNVADDKPAPPQDVIAEAATLLDLPIPPDIPFDEADMSPMARSFYKDNKRVANGRIKTELNVRLRYPDYHTGLRAILKAGG